MLFFFFKQKTAYEMRISDWSSDVCSSDLALKPLKIAVNPGNGGAGLMVDAIAPHLPFTIERLHAEPDGRFPNGIPNPLLPENRIATRDFVRSTDAEIGRASCRERVCQYV